MREGSSPDGRDDRPGDAHPAGGVEPDRRMPGTPAIFKDIEGMIFANRDRQKGWITWKSGGKRAQMKVFSNASSVAQPKP